MQAFIRKAYLGGRTEIFKPICEKGPLYCYDVNSLYPFAMLNEMPSGQCSWVYEYEKSKLGVYHAKVIVPEMWIPPLGILRNGKYIFPTGTFEGFFTSIEIEYAKTLGCTFEILEGVCFTSREKLFEKYVRDLYRIREESERGGVSDTMSKLLLNSLYGRFGMDPEKENIVFAPLEGSKYFTELDVRGTKYGMWKRPVSLDSFYNVAISCFVTSYARTHMHRLYLDAGDSLFYTDTDSIFVSKKMVTKSGLGELKEEGIFDSAVFLLPKTYALRSTDTAKVAMKGFDKKKIKHFTYEDFKLALEGDIKRLKIDVEPRFATMKTALRQKKFVAMTKASTKELRSKYSKREIIKSNGVLTTKPIQLTE